MSTKLHGYLIENEDKSDSVIKFSVSIYSFLEAVGAFNLLEANTGNKVFNINGQNYEVIGFTFGSDEPLVLECKYIEETQHEI